MRPLLTIISAPIQLYASDAFLAHVGRLRLLSIYNHTFVMAFDGVTEEGAGAGVAIALCDVRSLESQRGLPAQLLKTHVSLDFHYFFSAFF